MQIGPYRLENTVERYGEYDEMTVSTARHMETGQAVLLTALIPASAEDSAAWIERLKAVRSLRHANLLTFENGAKTPDGVIYVAMPPFPPALRHGEPLNLDQTLALLHQVGAGLDYAHRQGVVHGRLRRIHLVRLGDSRYALRGFELGQEPDATPADDLAALARLVYYALTGHDFIPTMPHWRALPAALAAVLAKAVSVEAGFGSAVLFYRALSKAADSLPPGQRERPPRPVPQAAKMGGGISARLLVVLAGIAALVLFIGGKLLVGAGQPRVEPAFLTGTALALLPTDTLTFTVTPSPTSTFTATATPSSTRTFTPTATSTPPPSATPTETLVPTETATRTPSYTRTPTLTRTPLPTRTPTAAPTTTPTASFTPTPAPTATAPPPTATLTNYCVTVAGDSVTAGGAVYEVPATGYVFAKTGPVASFVEQEFRNLGNGTIQAFDRGGPNTGISSTNHPSYFDTQAYQGLIADHCRYTVIMPWVNDITPAIPGRIAAPRHAAVLVQLVAKLATDNPPGRILVMDYYEPAVSQFALNTWAAGFTRENIDLYNREIQLSCEKGTLSRLPQVVCLHTQDAFLDLGKMHVIGPTSRAELYANLIAPISENATLWLQHYYAINPDGLILGDGVHLSRVGKISLASFLVRIMNGMPELAPPG